MEMNVTPVVDGRTRKPRINKLNWARTKAKKLRYSPTGLPQAPVCNHATKSFKCTTLKMVELRQFHALFYAKPEKIYQDTIIAQYCENRTIKRRRPKNGTCIPRTKQTKFYVRNFKKQLVPVCQKTFLGILQITRRRVSTVLKNLHSNGEPPTERRGGDRKTKLFEDRKKSVMNFINKFKCIESHYCRSQTTNRLYLSSDLNINKMYTMYCRETGTLPVKASYFRTIFNTCYNLGFGSPLTDVCSLCQQLKEKIKVCKDEHRKTALITEHRVHKLRAKAYYDLLRESATNENIITFSFDCEKNQVLPKLPDQQAYYSRQFYAYNFSVVRGHSKDKLNSSTVRSYCWTENEFNKGSNEIASCIFHTLQNSNFHGINTVRLMCDGCGGQNKNSTLIGMCAKWLMMQDIVNNIEIVFPVRGHSFIPPDRVFGLNEKEIKKLEVILKPEDYYEIFAQHATVYKVGEEVPIFDWKADTSTVMKPTGNWHFSFAQSKRFFLKKTAGQISVRGETTYKNQLGVSKGITKRGKKFTHIMPPQIPKRNAVKEEKKTDVQSLLTAHYGENWRDLPDLQFYKFVIDNGATNEEDDPVNLCEHVEDVPDLLV